LPSRLGPLGCSCGRARRGSLERERGLRLIC
jgi:hypothetical protein